MTAGRDGAAAPLVVEALTGRRERALLDLPSVAAMADLLARRTASAPVVRAAVTTLDRFRTLAGVDLEGTLAAARQHVEVAETALRRFASALDGYADTQVATLAFGAKVWFRSADVSVSWRPLPAALTSTTREAARHDELSVRALLLAMIGSGLDPTELQALRVGDAGSMAADGSVIPDIEAEPLAVALPDRLAFLTFEARAALLARLDPSVRADPTAPLLGIDPAVLSRAEQRHAALIEAGNDVNVATCRVTGDFFRAWGMPGARWQPAPAPPDAPTHPENRGALDA